VYQLAPGGPLQFLDDDPTHTGADYDRLTQLYGLNRPVLVQYLAWLAGEDWFAMLSNGQAWQSGRCLRNVDKCGRGILRFDFGRSFHFKGESVIDLIVERMPATFLLAASSLVISVVVGSFA